MNNVHPPPGYNHTNNPEPSDADRVRRIHTKFGYVALAVAILTVLVSVIPFVGVLAIGFGLVGVPLGILAIIHAKRAKRSVTIPATATGLSFGAIFMAFVWVALIFAFSRGVVARQSPRPYTPPQSVAVRQSPQPAGQPRTVTQQIPAKPTTPPLQPVAVPVVPPVAPANTNDDERAHKQLLEDLARDRLLETIRSGPGLPITATKLEEAYQENIVAAELKYKNAVLELTGTVIRVTRDNGSPFYTLKLEGDAEGAIVNCDFTEKAKHPLAALERGHTVKLRGLCVGRENDSIRLKDCIVVK